MESSATPPTNRKELSLPPHIQKTIDEEYRYAAMTEQFKQELSTDPRYQAYFDLFLPDSIQPFIHDYALRKTQWLRYGEMWVWHDERRQLHWYEAAYRHLWLIQQKKLFNLQCLWRAEQITLPGIEICADFSYTGECIECCTLIPPITEAELAAYGEFISSSAVNLEEDYNNWQDYATWKGEQFQLGDSDINYPAWFAFFDERFGTKSLLDLPDIRGEKENKYLDLWRNERDQQCEQTEALRPPEPTDPRPDLDEFNYDIQEAFIRQFEDKTLLEYFLVRNRRNRDELPWPYHDEYLQKVLDFLWEIEEELPSEAAETWQDGLLRTKDRYERQQFLAALPAAYQDYRQRIELNIPIPRKSRSRDLYERVRQIQRRHILRGRELCGEPQNLEF
jgi:hypothetical protein